MINFFRRVRLKLDNLGFFRMSDEDYLRMKYLVMMNKKLNLENPRTFNEKLQWLKLHDRNSIYTKLVDKYEVKKIMASKIGEEYVIPTLGVYDKFDDINFDELPNQFVIKCTHDSGGLVIVKDKKDLDISMAKKKIDKCLRRNYYYSGREWPYKDIKPRIIVEKYMTDGEGGINDYKFFNFDGVTKIILVCSDRSKDLKETWYDNNFERLNLVEGGHAVDDGIKKPKELGEMIRLSKKISKDIPFVRTDFYAIDGRVYFGEVTFFPASGFEKFDPEIWDLRMGEMLKIKK